MRFIKSFMVLTIMVLLTWGVWSQSQKPNVSAGMVSYPSGDETVTSFLAMPSGKGPFPAVVVIQEWWGLTDWIKGNAQKLAENGYFALAVDLYRGKVGDTPELAHELMRGLPEDRAIRDLKAAVAYLKTREDVKKNKIGSIGWCMGGGFSLKTATNVSDLAACVVNYGAMVTDENAIKSIPCPVILVFGDQEKGIPLADVEKFKNTATKLGKKVDYYLYQGEGHGFVRAPKDKKNSDDAWEKELTFLAKCLK
jgi:carboxymethylenebutenolidase